MTSASARRRSLSGRYLLGGPFRLAAPHHFLAVGIQAVVNDPLAGVDLMVVLEAQVAEPFSDRIQARRFGLLPQRVVGVGPVDDLRQEHQGPVGAELVLFYDGI